MHSCAAHASCGAPLLEHAHATTTHQNRRLATRCAALKQKCQQRQYLRTLCVSLHTQAMGTRTWTARASTVQHSPNKDLQGALVKPESNGEQSLPTWVPTACAPQPRIHNNLKISRCAPNPIAMRRRAKSANPGSHSLRRSTTQPRRQPQTLTKCAVCTPCAGHQTVSVNPQFETREPEGSKSRNTSVVPRYETRKLDKSKSRKVEGRRTSVTF